MKNLLVVAFQFLFHFYTGKLCKYYLHKVTNLMQQAQKLKFSIKDFSSKSDQIHRNLWIWSHLLEKFLMGNSFFCVVSLKQVIYIKQKQKWPQNGSFGNATYQVRRAGVTSVDFLKNFCSLRYSLNQAITFLKNLDIPFSLSRFVDYQCETPFVSQSKSFQ